MKDHLRNLANILAIQFCVENDIDCSGSHINKHPRKQMYVLMGKKPVMTITFHKTSVPTYQIY